MKKMFLTVYIALSATAGFAQLTLEHRYDSVDHFRVVNLDGFGQKYAFYKTPDQAIKLYNDDHSVFRIIPVSLPAGVPFITDYWWMATKLVDNDTIIEVGLSYNQGQKPVGLIIKEDGSVFQTFDSIYHMQPVEVNGNWKLLMRGIPYNSFVYDASGTYTPVIDPDGKTTEVAAMMYPNPMDNAATLKYTLPEGVDEGTLEIYNLSGQKLRSYRVDRQFNSVLIQRGGLPGGAYFYQLKAGNQAPVAKQFIIN